MVCEGRDDASEYADIHAAMKVLMFSDNNIWDIHRILASILHMGNIQFKAAVISKFIKPNKFT